MTSTEPSQSSKNTPPSPPHPPLIPPPPTAHNAAERPSPPARLTRSQSDRKISGLCGGLGTYTGIDSNIFRVLFFALIFLNGLGLLFYIIGWVLIPQENKKENIGSPANSPTGQEKTFLFSFETQQLWGMLFLFLAALILFQRIFDNNFTTIIVFIGIGLALLFLPTQTTHSSTQENIPSPTPTPTDPSFASPTPTDPSFAPPLGIPISPQKHRPTLIRLTLALLFFTLAGTITYDLLDRQVDWEVYAAIPLGIIGVSLIIGAWVGKAKSLFFLGLALLILLGAGETINISFNGGIGDHTTKLTRQEELQDPSSLGIGSLTLDLQDISLPHRQTVQHKASVGIGKLTVLLPPDAERNFHVELKTSMGIGLIELFPHSPEERESEGFGVEIDKKITTPTNSEAGTLTLDLQVGIGDMEIRRGTP